MSDLLPVVLRRTPEQNLKLIAWFTGTTIAGAAITGAATLIWNLGPLWVAGFGGLAALGTASYLLLRVTRPLLPLRRWKTLTETTDLVAFAEANKDSAYMPSPILDRPVIRHLSVMGNGCGKWTRLVVPARARQKFRAIRSANGRVRFLASCPIRMVNEGDEKQRTKAVKNAKSLLVLRELRDETKDSGGEFEIKIYPHLATLRLIIVDDNECIVGHYQEDGVGDSLDTPLLVFRCNNENEWGFGHAFRRLFESEWKRSRVPTDAEWTQIEGIAAGNVG